MASPYDANVPSLKVALRKELRAQRRRIAASRDLSADAFALARHAESLARELVLNPGAPHRARGRAPVASAYESWEGEPPTAPLIAALQGLGMRVVVPITEPDLDLNWCDVADPARTPLGHDAVREVDLLLIPGLAVDARGYRMGQGGGCYDRALTRSREGVPAICILHPGEQYPDELPTEPHDRPVQAHLSADGIQWLAAGARSRSSE